MATSLRKLAVIVGFCLFARAFQRVQEAFFPGLFSAGWGGIKSSELWITNNGDISGETLLLLPFRVLKDNLLLLSELIM